MPNVTDWGIVIFHVARRMSGPNKLLANLGSPPKRQSGISCLKMLLLRRDGNPPWGCERKPDLPPVRAGLLLGDARQPPQMLANVGARAHHPLSWRAVSLITTTPRRSLVSAEQCRSQQTEQTWLDVFCWGRDLRAPRCVFRVVWLGNYITGSDKKWYCSLFVQRYTERAKWPSTFTISTTTTPNNNNIKNKLFDFILFKLPWPIIM